MRKLLGVLVVLSLAANVGLGYFTWVLRDDLDNSRARLGAEVSAAETRLTAITQEVMAEVPDVDDVRRDVESLQADVDDLENTLFGPTGAGFETDALGSLQDDVRSLKGDVAALKFCVNSAFGRLQDYAARVAAYMGLVATGGFGVRPSAVTPQCY
jgi:hypothetical protein